MKKPNLHPDVKIAPGAVVIGDVTMGQGCGVWYNAVIRGDIDTIVIGENTNVQDGCLLHVSRGAPLNIGNNVSMGHGAIVHGCTIGDNTLIGMGATVMDHAVVGKNCVVAAGALVLGGTVVPDGSMVMGAPAKVKRPTTEDEWATNTRIAKHYAKNAAENL